MQRQEPQVPVRNPRAFLDVSNKENNSKCILYNQRDATYTMFFVVIRAVHVLSGRQQESMTIPKAAHTVL